MPKEVVCTDIAPTPQANFSQAIKSNGMVYVSGTGPFHAATGKIVGNTIQVQVAQRLKNISAILRAAGSSLERVVSATFMLVNESDVPGLNEEMGKVVSEGSTGKARCKTAHLATRHANFHRGNC